MHHSTETNAASASDAQRDSDVALGALDPARRNPDAAASGPHAAPGSSDVALHSSDSDVTPTPSHSLKPLIAIAAGSFALGSAEFGMMGVLPEVAGGLNVSIPFAGNFISAYASGVCVGTLFLVFGRRVPPKRLLVFFAALMVIGNALSSIAPNAETFIAARFVAGLPHGAYFGTATIVASSLAERGAGRVGCLHHGARANRRQHARRPWSHAPL